MTGERSMGIKSMMMLILCALAMGCGDSTPSSDDSSQQRSRDAASQDSTEVSDDAQSHDVGPGLAALQFVDASGDDEISCVNTDHCSIYLSSTGKRTLSVVYTVDGEGREAHDVTFEIQDDATNLGHLNAKTVTSGSDGVASVEVSVSSGHEASVGEFTVVVSSDDEGVSPLFFAVTVTPKGFIPLIISTSYEGMHQWEHWQALLYRQDPNAPEHTGCANMDRFLSEYTADWQSSPTVKSESIKKLDFTDLQVDGEQHYTIFVYALDPETESTIQMWGCDDTAATIQWGLPTQIHVALVDKPPVYTGFYSTWTSFDLVSALPPPIDTYVYAVLDIFQDPVAGLLSLFCQLEDSTLMEVCELIFVTPETPDINQLTASGSIITGILNGIITSVAEGTTAGDVLMGGKDISDVLTSFEVDGTLSIVDPPDSSGHWQSGGMEESWDGITIKWSLGAGCDPQTDEGCGKKHYTFAAIQGPESPPPVSATFEAHVTDTWMLTIDPHPLHIEYGLVLNFVIENVLLPLLAGDGSAGTPVVDSYELFLEGLLGGTECLMPGFGMSCCEKFSDDVTGGGAAIAATLVQSACESLVTSGAAYLREQILQIDGETGDVFTIGTPLESPCTMIDPNHDFVVDGLGEIDERCQWDLRIKAFGVESAIEAEFYADKVAESEQTP